MKKTASSSAAKKSSASARWSVERRLAFIEARLFWLGEVNRLDLARRFSVSLGQASADIARYLAHAPKGVHYDKKAKRYTVDASYRPVMAPPDAAQFLGELRLVDAGLLNAEDTMVGWVPAFDGAPLPERKVNPFVLRAVLGAIRKAHALDVLYQSMSRPEPLRRIIEPHALAHDGFRWHVRAFDRETSEFRDVVIGRIAKAKQGAPARSSASDDHEWREFVELRIAPHPALTLAQAKAIGLDYGIGRAPSRIRVRRALLFYALRRLGLDVKPNARPPQEQHIVLVNRDEIEALQVREAQT